MKLEKKIYETDKEKRRDFWIGFGGWFGINLTLGLVSLAIGTTGFRLEVCGILVLTANLAGLTFFGFTRSRMALGALAAFGAALVLYLCAGLGYLAWCFLTEAWH